MFRSGTYNRFRPFPDARLIHMDNRACVLSKEQRLTRFILRTSPTFPALQRATGSSPSLRRASIGVESSAVPWIGVEEVACTC